MIYKILFAIINVLAVFYVPFIVYCLAGIIATIGIIWLDMPRVKKILKDRNLEDTPMGLFIFMQFMMDWLVWIYSLLNFTWLVFSGRWEKELNAK